MKKEQGNTYQTLQLFMNTFSWFLRQNGLENFILSISFKSFKNGLRRVMLGGQMQTRSCPSKLHESMNLAVGEERLLFFLMVLEFNCFMRIGEVLQLRVRDVKVHDEERLLSVYFMKSKADQSAKGVLSYVPITGDVIDPTLYIDVLTTKAADDLVCPWKDRALTSRLRSRLRQIGAKQ